MTRRLILVTGAGGFVCSQVAVELAAAGFDVIGTDHRFDAEAKQRLAGIRCVEGELANALAAVTGTKPFAVVHGAAITAGPAALGISAAVHVRRNMDLLTGCLDWARSAGARRFVFLSSTGVFCAKDGTGALTELSSATARGPYSAAKKAGEIVAQGAADDSFETVSLRLGNMFGPHEASRPTRPGLGLVAKMVGAAKSDGVIQVNTPDAIRDWTWLPDIGQALANLLITFPTEITDVLHCGSSQVLTDLELAEAIAVHFPGVRIEVNRGHAPATKGPMGSAITSALSGFDWTPVHVGLSRLLKQKAMQ